MNLGDARTLVRIEDTREFEIIIVSKDQRSQSFLFPPPHDRLGRFKNITSIPNFSELLRIYLAGKGKKLVVFVDAEIGEPLDELKKMIYAAHAEGRGLLFAFSSKTLTQSDFEQLINAGFDDVFDSDEADGRNHSRIYSWMRRFGGSPISQRDAVSFLGKRNARIGTWTILANEKIARSDSGQQVELTQQEVDFLTLLFDDSDLIQNASYEKFFKAPHAIVHKLKKKLGDELPIRHEGSGRYLLTQRVELP